MFSSDRSKCQQVDTPCDSEGDLEPQETSDVAALWNGGTIFNF